MRPRSQPASSPRGQVFALLALAAAICGAAMLPLYVLIHRGELGRGAIADLTLDLIPGLEAVVMVYLVSYFVLFKRGLSREALLEAKLDQMTRAPAIEALYDSTFAFDFGLAIAKAQNVVIVAQYLNTWAGVYADALTDLFQRGGTLTAFFADPRADDIARRVTVQLDRTLFNPSDHRSWVLKGARDIFEAGARAGASDDQVKLYVANEAINYFAIGIDNERVVFVLHDHFATGGIRAPGFQVSLREAPAVARFVLQEFDGFTTLADKVRLTSTRQAAELLLDGHVAPTPPTSRLDNAKSEPAEVDVK